MLFIVYEKNAKKYIACVWFRSEVGWIRSILVFGMG